MHSRNFFCLSSISTAARVVGVTFLGSCLLSGAATMSIAGDPVHVSTWDHNGSTMVMEKRRRNVEIRYEEPSKRMRRIGVKSGEVLFEGRVNRRNKLVGEAYVYRRNCQPAGYEVRGRFTPGVGQDEIILRGAAPIRERGGCDVIDYSRNRNSARLLFTLVGQDGHGGREDDFEGQEGVADDRVTEPPSFNCQPYVQSGKCPEAMICSSGELSSQDAMMGRLYRDVLALTRSSSERNRHKQEQREALRDRNACSCDFNCLQSWYYNMNKSLGKTTVILGR